MSALFVPSLARSALSRTLGRPRTAASSATALLHTTSTPSANVSPLIGTGPPPEPPVPSPEAVSAQSRVARRRRQAEMMRAARTFRDGSDKIKTVRKRFWEHTSVKEVDGLLQVFLDARPLRHPTTKEIVCLPRTKHALATALAIEWDQLSSAQDTTKSHLLPLTSLVCRALDIAADDACATPTIRPTALPLLLRYLDTDSVLCWAPEPEAALREPGASLREIQREAAKPLVSWLSQRVWPGARIEPVLDSDSIVPRRQDTATRALVQQWAQGLDAWDFAGLERAIISGKSFLVAARLVSEWSSSAGVLPDGEVQSFTADEAARVANIEVDWQTQRWGEVEDTHDVEKQDIRRHYGSVVLLVSGSKE
ncbi:ATP synthase mitochondrial F1 complex assembly factor 2 [Ceratocystis pirilliformis]|uniref:ATP synthase mitochondrial F1 complex assembly factor 2 n=1 Tax=Ceratocystis pirilliformis TaxID=259994 RepID=A0ABR3Z1Z1_9PEZI